MKLPNNLIKAKDREIHEFEYRNGKYIHKYVLGGQHEMTPQEVVDCLNGLATIDCDLQTAYAYIQSQKEKLTLTEKALELACEDVYNSDYECIQADYENGQELINVYKNNAKEMMKSE